MAPARTAWCVLLVLVAATSAAADEVDDRWDALVEQAQWKDQIGLSDLLETVFQDCGQDRSHEERWTPAEIALCKNKQRAVVTCLSHNTLLLNMDLTIVGRDAKK